MSDPKNEEAYTTTYIIGKKGSLRYFVVEALTKKELEPHIKKLLEEEV